MTIIFEIVLFILGIQLLIKMFPVILRFLKYAVVAMPLWIVFFVLIPGFLDECGLLILLFLFACFRGLSSGSSDGGYYSGYVLNKKTGVIHDSWDSDADRISDKNRRVISFSDALELINRGKKYHFRKK